MAGVMIYLDVIEYGGKEKMETRKGLCSLLIIENQKFPTYSSHTADFLYIWDQQVKNSWKIWSKFLSQYYGLAITTSQHITGTDEEV